MHGAARPGDPMHLTSPIRLAAPLVAVVLGLCAEPAQACSPFFLCKPRIPFFAGAQIPASALAIPLQLPAPMQPPYEPIVPQLRDAGGAVVAVDLVADSLPGWTLLKPVKGFADHANYTLHLPGFCQDGNGAVLPPDDVTFTTGAKASVPAALGTLVLGALPPTMVSVWTASGSCTVPILAARGTVALDAPPELAPWHALARAELWLDGQVWTQAVYGDLPLVGDAQGANDFGRTVRSFFVACGDVPSMADAGLKPGPHHVDVRVHIAGAFNDAPYLFGDVTVACAATPDTDASATGDADTDATGAFAECGVAAPDGGREGGCSAGSTGHRAGWWAIGFLALALLGGGRWLRPR